MLLRVRKRYRVSLLAVIVGALMVPVGYALSTDSAAPRSHSPIATYNGAHQTAASAVAAPLITHTPAPSPADGPAVPDAAKLLVVGTSLFGLAAAVRKAH